MCDDSRVSSISHEKNVVTRAAYLLFYRRQETFTAPSIESSLEAVETIDREKDDVNEQESDSRKEIHGTDDDDSNKTEMERFGTGNLVIDTSEKASELADFDEMEEPNEVGGVPFIMLDDDAELGYTDMDSVDWKYDISVITLPAREGNWKHFQKRRKYITLNQILD